MNISSYVFQSPYPNQFQIGRPDPSLKQNEQQQEAADGFNKIAQQPLQKEVEGYLSSAKTGASVNVANSVANSDVSAAIESFTSANNLVQAASAYNS